MTDRELLELALKLVSKHHARETILVDWEKSVIEAIRARLAEDDDEPFLWVETEKGELNRDVTCMFSDSPAFIECPLPLYRRPQPKALLTDAQILDAANQADFKSMETVDDYIYVIARAIEDKIWGKAE